MATAFERLLNKAPLSTEAYEGRTDGWRHDTETVAHEAMRLSPTINQLIN